MGYVAGILEYFPFTKGFVCMLRFLYFGHFLHALYLTKNIAIAAQAGIITTYIQMFSYGYGFLESWIKLNVLKMKPEGAFETFSSK